MFMGVFRFIIGVLGILLIIGTASAFLPLVLLGGISSGSVGFAFGFPIVLFIIGAIMVYFGFYSSRGYHNFKYLWFIKWGLVHSFSIWLASIILLKLNIYEPILTIFSTGLVISIMAFFIRKSHFNIKWFSLYFMIHSASFWIINFYLLPWIGINDLIIKTLTSGFIIAGITSVTGKLNLRKKEIAATIILFVLIIFFNYSGMSNIFSNLHFNATTSFTDNSNIKTINPLCEQRIKQIIGDNFFILYNIQNRTNSRKISSFNTQFLGNAEEFDSNSHQFGLNPLKYSKTTTKKVINSNVRLGSKPGENKDWLYGNINYEYTYIKKDIADPTGVILGDNHFKIRVKIDDLSYFFPEHISDKKGYPAGKLITVPTSDIVTISDCGFVN